MEKEIKSKIKGEHGGARPGAGRKKTTKKVTFPLDLDLNERIADIKNKSRFFNSAIREKLDRIEAIIKDAEGLE